MPACSLPNTISIGLFGKHNRSNAVLVAAVLDDFGLNDEQILHALSTFTGAARRLEVVKELSLGDGEGITLVSDYAHHPTEVAATINAARERWPQAKINVVFQPHQAQRFQDYRDLYVDCLNEADMVALLPIFRARDVESCSADSRDLLPDLDVQHPQRLHNFCEKIEESINWTLSNSTNGSVVLCLGAGDIDGHIRKLH